MRTVICDLLGIDYPILQGGMAWAAAAPLVAAVSAAGGLGIIGAGSSNPEILARQIEEVRQLTGRPFGVNIMLQSPHVEGLVEVVCALQVPVVTTGAGNPGKYMEELKAAGIRVIPVVSSAALARRLERSGADAIIAEGEESGGHVGEVATSVLVPHVVDSVSLPVIAAGGLADGRGLVAALAWGAAGVQMGTRFLCAAECKVSLRVKEKIIQANERDTVVTGRSTGHPVRVLRNRLSRKFELLETRGASVEELDALGRGRLRAAMVDGDVENGSVMAGQSAALVKEIKPAREILQDIVRQAEEIIKELAGLAERRFDQDAG